MFENKVAIVTGAAEGIGLAVVKALADEGAKVLLNDIDEARATAAANELGDTVKGIGGDVADIDTVKELVTEAVNHYGRLDIAIANAGLTSWGTFLDYSPEQFERVVSVNLRGSYFFAQAAAQQMHKQGEGGRLIFMSSVTGHRGVPRLSAYGMTKAGLEMLAKHLMLELSPLGITVNCVAPGSVLTPRNLRDDPNYEVNHAAVIPTSQIIRPEDIASAVLFLASDAARQITGKTLVVDGGWTDVGPAFRSD